MCLAPQPEFQRLLEQPRDLPIAPAELIERNAEEECPEG
jgi:hypothetical protein